MTFHERMESLTRKVADKLRKVDRKSVECLVDGLVGAKRVFVCGAGRSGLVVKAFAMRLMHLGFTAHVVGEATTPAITNEDVLLAVSGSGETSYVKVIVQTAKNKGAKIIAITSHPDSSIGKLADGVVMVEGRKHEDANPEYVARQLEGHELIIPLGTLFELSAMVFLDCIVEELMRKEQKGEAHMARLHTDLE